MSIGPFLALLKAFVKQKPPIEITVAVINLVGLWRYADFILAKDSVVRTEVFFVKLSALGGIGSYYLCLFSLPIFTVMCIAGVLLAFDRYSRLK